MVVMVVVVMMVTLMMVAMVMIADDTALEDWRNVTHKQICDNGGSGLLYGKYKGSLPHALCAVYHPRGADD